MKRGQVSIFILIGLLLLLFAGFFVFVQQNYISITPASKAQVAVEDMVTSCLNGVSEEAFFIAGFQGGYIEIDDSYYDLERQQHYYYYYKDISPELSYVYELMQAYILTNTIDCVNDNPLATMYDMRIDQDAATVSIASGTETTVDLLLPIIIVEGDQTTTISKFSSRVSVDFEKMYAIATEIVSIIAESDPLVCMSCVHDIAEDSGVMISINDYEQLSDYYVLFDQNAALYDIPYTFAFIIRMQEDYDISGYFDQDNSLELELERYTAHIGEEFYLNINTEEFLSEVLPSFIDDPSYTLIFSDYSNLFDIDPLLGVIRFIPISEQIGTHSAIIKIEDSNGNVEYVSLDLVIE